MRAVLSNDILGVDDEEEGDENGTGVNDNKGYVYGCRYANGFRLVYGEAE